VAQMGTALTEPQLKQLSKYARRLILALDPDVAGIKATMRGLDVARQIGNKDSSPVKPIQTAQSLDLAQQTIGESRAVFEARPMMREAYRLGIELLIITVPQGKDPDDLIREDPRGWQTLVEKPQTLVDYVIKVGTSHLTSKSTFTEREQAARDLLPLIMAT